MKKLMIVAAIVFAAIASQASYVNWGSGANKAYFLDTAALSGNGSYAVSSTLMKDAGYTFAYVLSVSDVADANGTVAFNSYLGSFQNNGITVGATGAIATGTTYNYLITITTSLSGLGVQGEWDYSKAVATTTLSGTFKGATGSSILTSGVPATWTVSGAVQGEWDYSSAVATTTLSGTLKGATGSSILTSGVPSSWTVSGAVQEEPVPEPTSGLLMLVGMAGLALRRKQK